MAMNFNLPPSFQVKSVTQPDAVAQILNLCKYFANVHH